MMTPPERTSGSMLVRSFCFFAAGYLGAFALALLLFHVGRKNPAAPDEPLAGNLALGAYMLFVLGAPPAGAFAIVTSPWPAWARARPIHAAWLSIAAGFATYAAQLTGAVNLLVLVPLPAGFGWLAAALRVLLPGIAAGLLALAIAFFIRPSPRPVP
jgi:hypothetical protein